MGSAAAKEGLRFVCESGSLLLPSSCWREHVARLAQGKLSPSSVITWQW